MIVNIITLCLLWISLSDAKIVEIGDIKYDNGDTQWISTFKKRPIDAFIGKRVIIYTLIIQLCTFDCLKIKVQCF